jgi:hypothetical protein
MNRYEVQAVIYFNALGIEKIRNSEQDKQYQTALILTSESPSCDAVLTSEALATKSWW